MSEKVSLIRTRENELEFEISITGAKNKGTQVRFVVEADSMQYSFVCSESKDDTWNVTIPSLPFLAAKEYPFHIEIVADGYFFTPMSGEVLVEDAPEVKATKSAHVAAPVVGAVKVKSSPKKKVKEEVEEIEEEVIEEEEIQVPEPVLEVPEPKEDEDEDEIYEKLADSLIKGHRTKTPQKKATKTVLKETKKPTLSPVPKQPVKAPAKPESKPVAKPTLRESNLTAALQGLRNKKVEPKTETDKKVLDILNNLKH